jgi:hypothetical protein
MLAIGVAPRAENAYGLVAGPDRPTWCRVAVVQGEFRLVQRGPDPGLEVVAVGHALSMLLAQGFAGLNQRAGGSIPSRRTIVMSQDIRRHLESLTRLWSGLANSLGLIIHGWVEDQFADDLAGGGLALGRAW